MLYSFGFPLRVGVVCFGESFFVVLCPVGSLIGAMANRHLDGDRRDIVGRSSAFCFISLFFN